MQKSKNNERVSGAMLAVFTAPIDCHLPAPLSDIIDSIIMKPNHEKFIASDPTQNDPKRCGIMPGSDPTLPQPLGFSAGRVMAE